MAKNNKLIEQMKVLAARNHNDSVREAAENDTVQIYSVMAIALYNMLDVPENEKVDCINQVFSESQRIWLDAVENSKDVVELCKDVTGIEMTYGQ